MGYNVYITRAEHWLSRKEHPISEVDWQALLHSDTTLVTSDTDHYTRRTKDGTQERFPLVLWTAHPDQPPFLFMDGAVHIKSPDDETVQKMVEMARILKARVIGEEGEFYD
jgi:hypothetical protein